MTNFDQKPEDLSDARQFHRQCVIHASCDLKSRDSIGRSLSEALGMRYQYGTLWADWASMSVELKDEWDRKNHPGETYSLEVTANDGVPTEVFKSRLKSLLIALDFLKQRPIPSCDFEDELSE